MRLLHVTPYFERAWAYGGIPRVVTIQTTALARRGHEVTVVTTDAVTRDARWPRPSTAPRGTPWTETVAGVRVHVFPNFSNRVAYDWQMFLPRGMRAGLAAHVREFDLVHIHACRNIPGVLAARAARRAGIPYVIQPHGTAPSIERRHVAKWVFDRTLNRGVMEGAARLIAVSEAERRQLRTLGIEDARIRIVPNPMNLDEFTPPLERGHFRSARGLGHAPLVMFLGKLTPRKRLDVLARAFASLPDRTARLVIAGSDMGYERELRRLVHEVGIHDRTTFAGVLRGGERLHALADADVVSYASRDEVFGLVALEAILCGTPVLVADDSGCGDLVRELGGGLVVPEGDAAALSRALTTILEAPEEWHDAAKRAQPNVRRLCDPDSVSEALEVVYREMAPRV